MQKNHLTNSTSVSYVRRLYTYVKVGLPLLALLVSIVFDGAVGQNKEREGFPIWKVVVKLPSLQMMLDMSSSKEKMWKQKQIKAKTQLGLTNAVKLHDVR